METKGLRVGYIRVSSVDQNSSRQLEGLELDRVFRDQVSAKDIKRPQLKALLEFVREGDVVFVHSLDRLARNLEDLKNLIRRFNESGVAVSFQREQLFFNGEDSPLANLLVSILGAFAEFERELLRERQREGIAIAKKKGLYKGRKPLLTEKQVDAIKAEIQKGRTKADLARELNISRATLYRYISGSVSKTNSQRSAHHEK